MLGISIDSRRYSHQLIERVGEFAINVVDPTFREAVELCGNVSGQYIDKFNQAGLTLLPAHCIKPPLISGALAHLECVVERGIPTGDHTFFIALVRYPEVCQASFTESWEPGAGNVLLCVQRDRFGTWAY